MSVWNISSAGLAVVSSLCLAVAAAPPAAAETLGAAVRKAVRSNPNGLAAGANARARAGELKATRGLYRPKVDVFGELGFENDAANGSSYKPDFTARIGVEARYTLYDGLVRANEVYRNAARLDASLYNALTAADTVALDAVEAYVDVVRHRQLLSIAERNIRRHREIRGQIAAQVAGGASPISDRYQIDERLLAARAVRTEIRKALADASAKYRRTVGHRPHGTMRIPGVGHLPRSLPALERAVLAHNTALKRSTKSIHAAEYALEGEKGRLRPKLELKGRFTEGNDPGGIKGRNRDAFVGLSLSWSIYDGGTSQARRETLHAERDEAEFRRAALRREVVEIAAKAWNSYTLGRRRAAVLATQERAAGRIVRNYREEYSLSKRSLLDVLDAERARFNTGFQRISARAASRFAGYRMLAVQSRLVSHFGAHPPVPVTRPDYENRVLGQPGNVFGVSIEPLR